MDRRTPEKIPAPASDDLAAAIERLVQERVDQALEQQPVKQPAHVQRLLDRQFAKPPMPTDYRQLPPTQKPDKKPAEFTTIWHRDGAGQLLWSETIADDGRRFITKVERDGAGAIVRCKTTPPDESPVLPALDIDYKAKARKYDPGEPR
jgi:hypothetical protein